jgi:hypothetical protein
VKFARYTFLIAAIYGLIVLLPQYFLENRIGIEQPPAITHPEFFYGFISVAVAFQFVFLIIASDPAKYRVVMLAALVEKFPFTIATIILYSQSRIGWQMLGAGSIDGLLGVLFLTSYLLTRRSQIS